MKLIKLISIYICISQSILFCQSGWIKQNSGTNKYLNFGLFLNDYTGYIVGNEGIVLKTTNGGSIWLSVFNQQNYNAVSASFLNEYFGWIYITNIPESDSTFVLKTQNGGLSWSKYFVDTCSAYNRLVDLQFVNNSVGYLNSNLGIYKTSNGGINWNLLFSYPLGGLFFVDQFTGWTGGYSSGVYKTTNGGNNWIFQADPYIQNQWGVDFSFVNNLTGYCIPKGFGYCGPIFSTTNGGTNWTRFFDIYAFRSIQFLNQQTGYCLAWSGSNYINNIAKTTNSGNNWIIHNINSTNAINALVFSSVNTGWVVGDSGTIMKTTNGGVTIGIQQIGTNMPVKYSLSQNYPNPFNPVTNINFSIPKFALVNITIYDVLGKEMEELVNRYLSPGTYKADWNAADYPSGVYYYSLIAGDFTETKKMMLIK